jgi:ABC-type phosphate/phosphonate transport system ATPase subunit/GNAT superfamily N-acetyltransferase
MRIHVATPIHETPRVLQVRGLFDLPEAKTSALEWDVDLPLADRPWHVGLIVGPSGRGKSTIARALWPEAAAAAATWPTDAAILDGFPEALGIKEVTEVLSSVGFSSPPAWLRPFHVLSTGQQFRVTLARLIAEAMVAAARDRPIVFDEYTSVVDRTVARVGSAALEKVIRRKGLQFVAVTCHEDVEAWLNPDWVYRPAEGAFQWRLLRRRPTVEVAIFRTKASAWKLFAPHHYLSGALLSSATCFMAAWNDEPVAFSAWVPFFGAGPPRRREHRTVTLPDYQGIGIGNVLSATIASMWTALGYQATSTTTRPAMIQARLRSPLWRMTRAPALAGSGDVMRHASMRLTAGFAYVGPPMKKLIARTLLDA